ncbi:MAG: hypothetical protein ACP5HU_04980 [Phycisphaerae bacterium]
MTGPHTRRNPRRRRGTVLLLAVGLVTIVAILGSTFLITSMLDAQQSEAIAIKAQAEPLARGIVERLRATLAADVYPNDDGPYGDLSQSGAAAREDWKKYIDYPWEDPNDPNRSIDPWLADPWRSDLETGGRWRHLSNLFEDDYDDVANLRPGDLQAEDPYVDTDGDGIKDALLHATGITDADGDEYYVAVRITDLGARSFLRDHAAAPANNTLSQVCYGIADQLWLHWHEEDSPTDIGRLYERLDDSSAWNVNDREDREMATVYNCYRPLMRHPDLSGVPERPYQRILLTDRDCLNDPEVRERLYTQLCRIAEVDQLDAGTRESVRRQIAHFVANLWSYISPGQQLSYAFNYGQIDGTGDKIVYGLTEQVVITEAYAYYWEEIDGSGNTVGKGEAYAIELMNPTDATLPVGRWNYFFGDIEGDGVQMPEKVYLRRNERMVIYAVDGDIPDDSGGSPSSREAQPGDFGFKPEGLHSGVYWYNASDDIDALRLTNDGRIDIWREAEGRRIPLDSISAEDINFNPPPVGAPPDEVCQIREGLRDDDWQRRRMTVAWDPVIRAEYDSDSEANRKDHSLGERNELTNMELADTHWNNQVFEGFYIYRRESGDYVQNHQAALDRLGEITRVYITGPAEIEGDYVDFPHAVRSYSRWKSRGRADFFGAVNTDTEAYPDVPWVAMVQEVIDLGRPGLVLPAEQDDAGRWRMGGRINVNTAPQALLEQLWSNGDRVPGTSFELETQDRRRLAERIISYRDEPMNREGGGATAFLTIPDLRGHDDSTIPGFMTPGEIAIPILRFGEWYLAQRGIDERDAVYHEAREWFYRSISNLVSVNSDAYAVNIVVQLQPRPRQGDEHDFENPRNRWNYLAIIDRSTCYGPGSLPAVRLFTEIK